MRRNLIKIILSKTNRNADHMCITICRGLISRVSLTGSVSWTACPTGFCTNSIFTWAHHVLAIGRHGEPPTPRNPSREHVQMCLLFDSGFCFFLRECILIKKGSPLPTSLASCSSLAFSIALLASHAWRSLHQAPRSSAHSHCTFPTFFGWTAPFSSF